MIAERGASAVRCMTCEFVQDAISQQHGSLVQEMEEQKAQVSYGKRWVRHAKDKNACKVCSRPFCNAAEQQQFIARFSKLECDPALSCTTAAVAFCVTLCVV
jgi:hypothetical protein